MRLIGEKFVLFRLFNNKRPTVGAKMFDHFIATAAHEADAMLNGRGLLISRQFLSSHVTDGRNIATAPAASSRDPCHPRHRKRGGP